MSRRPRLSSSDLVHGLACALHGSVTVGTRLEGQLDAGDGLVAVVAIEIRRGLAPAERARLHGIALAAIERSPELTLRCACRVNRGGKWHTSRPERDCTRTPSHALVYRAAWSDREGVTLVCSRHAEHHDIDPATMLGVIELLEQDLAPHRKHAEQARAEWRTKESNEEDERRARDEAAIERVIRANPGRTPAQVADAVRAEVDWFWSGLEKMGRSQVSRRAAELGVRLAPDAEVA